MKKFICTFLTVAFLAVVCSCSGRNSYAPSGYYKDDGYFSRDNELENGFLMGDESYNEIVENPFVKTDFAADSYFSMDSFTASYSNLRRYINNGMNLPSDLIRTDELINYFSYDIEKPTDGNTFSSTVEMGDCPWNEEHKLLTVGVATKEVKRIENNGNNIVFLIDVSGSMNSTNKLGLIKESFKLFVENLDSSDIVSVVTYANGVNTIFEGRYVEKTGQLIKKVNNLRASGGTGGDKGLERAYEIAKKYFIPGGNNRVIIASDGDFNIGRFSQEELKSFIEEKRKSGIYLTTLGFGMGNYKDTTMETLAKYGNGGYAYIDCIAEAKKVLVDELDSTLVTVAKDVKSNIEFNPNVVDSYRLIGYENKKLTKDEFDDEDKDAGEIGSGKTSIICYELVLKENITDDKLLSLNINYKDPVTSKSLKYNKEVGLKLLDKPVTDNYLFVASIVEFVLLLRSSNYMGNANYGELLVRLQRLSSIDNDTFKSEFRELVNKACSLNLIAVRKDPAKNVEVKINTIYGYKILIVDRDTALDKRTIINYVFGDKTTDKFEIAFDSDFTYLYKDYMIVTSNLELFIRKIEG